MYILAIFAPLIGAFLAGSFGRWIGDKGAQFITCACMLIATILGFIIAYDVIILKAPFTLHLANWITVDSFAATWSLRFDTLSCVMIVVVTSVSTLVHVYSIGYMHGDRSIPRFMSYLSLFTFLMLMLVTAADFIQLFLGWEGVGLASYLLIGYWYERPAANAAAMKAFLVNRVGDIGLALGVALIYQVFNSITFDAILHNPELAEATRFMIFDQEINAATAICALLFIGAMGKSAQLGLHVWLPDAMEGPTPVSALIHAATMVTAGVFMIVRMAPLFECAPAVLQVITCLGAVTALFAASVGLVQKDIKRIIAYSTCSQLGYMFFAIGVSSYAAALFHLVTHAFFKALLFLGAGSVIHAMSDEQDITRMGGVARRIPATYIFMWIGSLALAGMPGFAGYYSKDWILESAWSAPHEVGKIAYTLGILSAFATAFYSWRLLYLVFHGPSRADEKVSAHVHESGGFMLFPLAILALGAIFSGYLLHDFFQNLSLSSSLIPHTLPTWVTLLPTVAGIAGILLATLCYIAFPTLPTRIVSRLRGIHTFLYNKWYVDEIYQLILLKPFAKIAYFLWHRIDQQVIDNGGPNATTRIIHQWSKRVSRAHTGHLAHAAIVICSGLIVFISLCYWYKAT